MNERKKLSDILPQSDRDRLTVVWASTKAADDLKPIPAGEYTCRIADGKLFNSRSGTPGYKLAFEIIDGEHAGRYLWHDMWLTAAAIGMAKRDLLKIGISRFEQLEQPIPSGILATVRVVLRRTDDGTEHNRVARFDVVGIEPNEPEPFAPSPNGSTHGADRRDPGGFNWGSGEQEDPSAPGRGRGAYGQP